MMERRVPILDGQRPSFRPNALKSLRGLQSQDICHMETQTGNVI